MTKHEIIVGDSKDLSSIQNESVDLIVTSPPYPMIEMWDDIFSEQDKEIKLALNEGRGMDAFNKMHSILNAVWNECDRVLATNGFICINIGDATRTLAGDFQLYSNHAQIITFFMNKGYSVLPDIHWRKQSNAPNKFMGSGMYPAGAYVTYEHEYILVFRKGGKRTFTGESKRLRQKSAYFWEERNVWFSDLWEIKGTSQVIRATQASRDRNASFPFEIPYRLVNMYSAEGDTVLDPFAGLGTTALACMVANRNSISYDRDQVIVDLAIENISKTSNVLNDAIDTRLRNHVSFIDGLPQEKREKCYENAQHGFQVKTKQETAIKIDRIDSIKISGNSVICTYE